MDSGSNNNETQFKNLIKQKLNIRRKSTQLSSSVELLSNLIENKTNMNELIKMSIDGKIHPEFRSIMWKLYFGIISIDNIHNWEEVLNSNRQKYYQKVDKYYTSEYINMIHQEREKIKINKHDTHLLKQIEENNHAFIFKISTSFIQQEYQEKFNETLNIIKLDIDRTFQEIDLFRNNNIKDSLSKILFVWSIENADVGYCQGMNEILGTIYYALYPTNFHKIENNLENENLDTKKTLDTPKDKNFYFYLLNSEEHFEADIYNLFCEVMDRGFKELYNYNDVKFRQNYKNGVVDGFELIDKTILSLEDINKIQTSELKKKINKIFYFYLKIVDKELFLHIHDKVEPYLFLFRWILCILNREISLKNIIYVWEIIFAMEYLDKNLNFLDFICVSMIVNLRQELLNEDDGCYILSMLMHFPNEHNIKEIIKEALSIREKVYDYLNIQKEFVIID
jgi:TBC1 domain family protein 5